MSMFAWRQEIERQENQSGIISFVTFILCFHNNRMNPQSLHEISMELMYSKIFSFLWLKIVVFFVFVSIVATSRFSQHYGIRPTNTQERIHWIRGVASLAKWTDPTMMFCVF